MGNWISNHVYCRKCGHDWAAVYHEASVSLQCPACHHEGLISIVESTVN